MGYRVYNPERFTRHSLRLANRDYAAASVYFVTICTDRREPIFDIPELRKIVVETWQALPTRFPSITLDEFVVMPDHIHFILWLGNQTSSSNGPTLARVVGAYKSLVAVAWLNHIKANDLNCSGKVWQRSYIDRIVRIGELEQTRQYIRNNPTKLNNRLADHPDL